MLLLPAVIFVTSATAQSIYEETVQTRNLDPNWIDTSMEEYQAQISMYEPFRARVVIDCTDADPEMVILMEEGLSDSIGLPLLQQWIADIQSEKYTAELVEISYAAPEEIKAFLDSLYDLGLEGTALVGNLPAAWVAVWDTQISMGEQLPCDYFFMDLDGEWLDLWIGYPKDSLSGQDGFYDTFQGELDPEIWSGRIRVDNLDDLGDPVEMLQSYLARNHEWRVNGDPEPVKALCYVDDDWQTAGGIYQTAMQLLYENVELVDSSAQTCAQDYEEIRLPDTYSWISPHVHSNPLTHFWQPSAGTTRWDEIVPIAPPAHFYNLFACSNCRFTTAKYMGGVYSFASESGLAAVGSTTSGAMLWFIHFYGPLGGEASLGEAFELWWDYIANNGLSQPELNWHIGMVLLGDPSLVPSMHLTGIKEPDPAHSPLQVVVVPNPSTGSRVSVYFTMPETGNASLEVFNLSGRLVTEQAVPNCTSGMNEHEFADIQTGIYFVRMTEGGFTATRRFVVIE